MTDPALERDPVDIEFVELDHDGMRATDGLYDSLRFVRTDLNCTRTLVARLDGTTVGLSRLIDLGVDPAFGHVFELGGMWVQPQHRRRGIATRMLEGVLPMYEYGTPPEKRTGRLWCTPFAELMPLYEAHGFREVGQGDAPEAVVRRLDACAGSQTEAVVVTRGTGEGCRHPTDATEPARALSLIDQVELAAQKRHRANGPEVEYYRPHP